MYVIERWFRRVHTTGGPGPRNPSLWVLLVFLLAVLAGLACGTVDKSTPDGMTNTPDAMTNRPDAITSTPDATCTQGVFDTSVFDGPCFGE